MKTTLNLFLWMALLIGSPVQTAIADTPYENVTFKTETAVKSGEKVKGRLSIPEMGETKLPAVVIIHNGGGIQDRTGEDYVAALYEAGIATLELDLFGRGRMPKSSTTNLPHTFGSLIYLAKHEKIDEKRIGIMGFSYGASLALVSATSVLTDEYTKRKYEYSAHIPLYGLCWAFKVWAEGGYKYAGKDNIFQSTTGAPVHILAGEKDQYEIDPEMCSKFVNALPNDVKNTFDVTVYPGALHGWDTHENRSYKSKYAYQGKGGRVFHERDEETAEKSVKFAVEFFQNNL